MTRLPLRTFLLLAALVALRPGVAVALTLPAGEGLTVVKKECTRCHALSHIANSDGRTRAEWETHVIRMTDIERRPANMKAVVDYLSAHFPK